jgi:protein tyrosine phosphatase
LKNSGYINANWVKKDKFNIDIDYIVTQGPLKETTDHFWEMVLENKVPVILMLTKLKESNREKCFKYWPSSDEKLKFKSLTVELISENKVEKNPIVHRQFKITSENEHIVDFVHFEGWPDYSVPKMDEFSILQIYVKNLMKDKSGPLTVHCSAGIGRTGKLIFF